MKHFYFSILSLSFILLICSCRDEGGELFEIDQNHAFYEDELELVYEKQFLGRKNMDDISVMVKNGFLFPNNIQAFKNRL